MIPAGTEDFFVIMCLACGFVLWRGGVPERITAVAVLLAWVASAMVHTFDWLRPQYGMLGVDLLLLVILVALALLSGRKWLMVAAACHLLTVGAHLAMMLDLRIQALAYLRTMTIWGYAVLLAMVVGTLLEAGAERRRRRLASGSPATSE